MSLKTAGIREFARMIGRSHSYPMAGKSLDFKGQVVEVREATPEDLGPMNAGCGCGDGCEDGCGDKEHKGGCSCGCH